jgi:hypothetical protein
MQSPRDPLEVSLLLWIVRPPGQEAGKNRSRNRPKAMNIISHDRSNRLVLIISLLGGLLIPSAAFAHHAEWMKGKPFIQGLSMPVHGLDHMLVTFAVGLIAG